MDDLYRQNILDHFHSPRNFGSMDKYCAACEEENSLCGDRIRMEIKCKKCKIDDVRFSGEGCAICIASASILTETVKGMSLSGIGELTAKDVIKFLGITLTPIRMKCALLPLEVLQKALKSPCKKQSK